MKIHGIFVIFRVSVTLKHQLLSRGTHCPAPHHRWPWHPKSRIRLGASWNSTDSTKLGMLSREPKLAMLYFKMQLRVNSEEAKVNPRNQKPWKVPSDRTVHMAFRPPNTSGQRCSAIFKSIYFSVCTSKNICHLFIGLPSVSGLSKCSESDLLLSQF